MPSTMGNPPHLVLRGYEGRDYPEKEPPKELGKNEYASWMVPAWRGYLLDSRQRPGDDCGFFEEQMVRCMEAFGAKLGRLYCDLEHRDLQECIQHDKKIKRFDMIRDVRVKKWLRGEIPHIYEPLEDFLKSAHGSTNPYMANQHSGSGGDKDKQ